MSWQGAEPARAVLEARNIRKSYGNHTVVDDVSLDVAQGQTLCIIGPSGSGKSTLLRCLAYLEAPDSGSVCVRGHRLGGVRSRRGTAFEASERQLARQRRSLGMVFQSFNLFPHMTAEGNCTLALRHVHHMSAQEALDTARRHLDTVGLADHRHKYPSQLSGGQQQRAAIARALCTSPSVLLFDEPTSALDPELVGEVLLVLRQLASSGTTMIIVTHEMQFAAETADRVAFMDNGVIVDSGTPEEVLGAPRNDRVRRFLSRLG